MVNKILGKGTTDIKRVDKETWISDVKMMNNSTRPRAADKELDEDERGAQNQLINWGLDKDFTVKNRRVWCNLRDGSEEVEGCAKTGWGLIDGGSAGWSISNLRKEILDSHLQRRHKALEGDEEGAAPGTGKTTPRPRSNGELDGWTCEEILSLRARGPNNGDEKPHPVVSNATSTLCRFSAQPNYIRVQGEEAEGGVKILGKDNGGHFSWQQKDESRFVGQEVFNVSPAKAHNLNITGRARQFFQIVPLQGLL